jgi:predicted secreted Zn-dependent protease
MRVVIRAPRSTVWLPALAVLAFLSLYIPLAGHVLSSAATAQPASTLAASHVKPSAGTPVVATATVAIPTSQPSASVPACSPLAFPDPSGLDLSATATGLHIQNDTPTYYQIYGNTASQLRTQITHCAPGATGSSDAEYTGETSYSLSWQYYTSVSNNGCTVTNVQVGIHIATALPTWQSTTQAATGLASRWQQFASALTTHEHGHAVLDANYAASLVQRLNALGPIDCNVITSTVQNTVDSTVRALNTANDTYDQQTDHGATQGAVLPTY